MARAWSLLCLVIYGAAFAQGYPDSVIATIYIGGDPHGVARLTNNSYLYVSNETVNEVYVVDVEQLRVVDTIPCGASPWQLIATPDNVYVYVANLHGNSVSVIRTETNSVVATIPVGIAPHPLACSPDGSRIYVGNIDSDNVSVIRTSDNTVVATVAVGVEPRGLCILPNGEYVYTANAGGSVSVIRTSDNQVIATLVVPNYPHRATSSRDGQYVYISNCRVSTVTVIRTSDNSIVGTLPVGSGPHGGCYLPNADYVYVASPPSSNLTVIRTTDNTVVATIPVGSGCCEVTPSGAGDCVYTADRSSKTVTVVGYRHRHDVCPVRIIAPTGTVDSGTMVEPLVLVKNQGTSADVFPVTLSIGSGYTATVQDTLPAGYSDTVRFPVWTAGPVGTSPVVCFTELVGDEVPANDTVTDSVRVNQVVFVDVGTTVILAPVGFVDSGTAITPAAVVRNFGTAGAIFPVTMTIDGFYTRNVIESLPAGAVDTVLFSSWTADSLGSFEVACHTTLLGDENPANDTVTDSVSVRRVLDFDVGPLQILSPPGTSDSGDVCVPSVVVRNFGQTAAFFPVTLAIGSGYVRTAQETLASGTSDTVVFPSWTAEPVGSVAVSCYTSLVGDEDPANDTIVDTVQVLPASIHDVGAVAIVSPPGRVRAGDTVIPRARIRNFGTTQERFFDVILHIGSSHNEKVNVAVALPPDSTVELTFAPWVADSGNWTVRCSTMLANDMDRVNDEVASKVRVFPQTLRMATDQSDRLEAGQGETYKFHALIEGDTGGIVAVARSTSPPGWSARLCDATGVNDLTDTDGDGMPDLGYVSPGDSGWFSLEVTAPSGTQGDTTSVGQGVFLVKGHVGGRPDIADTAVLTLTLLPELSIHNYPNPFSDKTSFVIGLPEDGKASLTIYTRAGQRVCRVLENRDMTAGVHVVSWEGVNDNGRSIAPGTYEYLLDYVHGDKTDRLRKKLVLTKE
jgi:YVTN family beta-propeller protein